MLYGQLALVAASLFSGAAVYINIAEQPARLKLETGALLTEWQPAYKKGLVMQASLAVIGFLLGLLTWWLTDEWRWLLGACVLIINWPYTFLVMMLVNQKLMGTDPMHAGTESRALIQKWGKLHTVRTGLGFASIAIFIWASVS